MEKTGMIGVDLGKRSFQLHGTREDGSAAFRRKVSRERFLEEMSKRGPCKVAMEACGGARHWSRELRSMGFEVRLVPPAYVKPFVKRQKNDAADAEAVCEAASRPGMRFVAAESAEQQAEGMLFRTRDLLTRQRTQTVNALRGHPGSTAWWRRRGSRTWPGWARRSRIRSRSCRKRSGSWAGCCSTRSRR